MSYQRCLRCGTDEYTGAYCTFCRTAEYELIEHNHYPVGHGSARECPLGKVENRGPAASSPRSLAINRKWLAEPIPDGAENYVIRHRTHPEKRRSLRSKAA